MEDCDGRDQSVSDMAMIHHGAHLTDGLEKINVELWKDLRLQLKDALSIHDLQIRDLSTVHSKFHDVRGQSIKAARQRGANPMLLRRTRSVQIIFLAHLQMRTHDDPSISETD